MENLNLWAEVTASPDAANIAFTRLDEALNLVLPGGDTHKRYKEFDTVGLAVVVAREHWWPYSHSPFNPDSHETLSFMADDQEIHPETWKPKQADEKMLGGPIPEGIGRFTAFAMAKVNTLSYSQRNTSFNASRDSMYIPPGQVGLAGGRRLSASLVAASGLWEVHDHIVSELYRDEVALEVNPDVPSGTSDDLAGEIEPIFDLVKSLHPDVEAADLRLDSLAPLLVAADGIVAFRRTLRAA